MRILHTSDWHLGRSLFDFSLLDDQQQMIEQLLETLENERIDAVVIAGDIYDRPVPPAQAMQLYDHFLSRAVGRMGIPMLAVAGNHDSPARLEFGSSLYASSGYFVCGQMRADIRRVTLGDCHGSADFWLMPYTHPPEVRALFPGGNEPVKTFDDAWRAVLGQSLSELDKGRRNIAVAHGFFSSISAREDSELLTSDSEVSIGGMDIADSGYFSSFNYAAFGHLHAPQRAGGENIRYSGSPLKYSLSEERQRKSYTLVQLDHKGNVEIRLLPVAAARDVRSVRGSLEQLLDPSYHENKRFGDYVFADLTDTAALYPMEKLRKLFPCLLGLRLSDGGGQASPSGLGAARPRLSPEEMFAHFFRDVKGYDMPEESLVFLRKALMAADETREVTQQ